MNADLQDPPEMISQFIKKWEEGYEVIYGIILKERRVSFITKILSSLAYVLIHKLTHSVFLKM